MKKINLRSDSGFTMTDLAAAILIFGIFTGIIGTLMYSSYKINLQTKMAVAAGNYAIQILEDIDKISYEEVTNGMEAGYKSKFLIPEGFDVTIEVSNYNEGTIKEDLIKKIRLVITYEFAGDSEKIQINRLKIKEV